MWQQLAEVMTPSIIKVVEFSKRVPGFIQVSRDLQPHLSNSSSLSDTPWLFSVDDLNFSAGLTSDETFVPSEFFISASHKYLRKNYKIFNWSGFSKLASIMIIT